MRSFMTFAVAIAAVSRAAAQSIPVVDPALKGDLVTVNSVRRWSPSDVSEVDDPRVGDVLENLRAAEALYRDLRVRYSSSLWSYDDGGDASNPIEAFQTVDEYGNAVRKCSKNVVWEVSGPQTRVRSDGSCWMSVRGRVRELLPSYRLCFDGKTSWILDDSGLVEGHGDAIANEREGYTLHSYAARPHRLNGGPTEDETLGQSLRGLRREPDGTFRQADVSPQFLWLGRRAIDGLDCLGLAYRSRSKRTGLVRSERHYWFAVDKNLVPILVEKFVPLEAVSDTGSAYGPDVVVRNTELFEIAPGVWFPGQSRMVRLDREKLWNGTIAVNYRQLMDVHEAELGPELDAAACEGVGTDEGASWYRVRDGEIVESNVPSAPVVDFDPVSGRSGGGLSWRWLAGVGLLLAAVASVWKAKR